jgi:nicotianamine synthase
MATTIQTLQILEPIQNPQQLPIHSMPMATKMYRARIGAYKPPKKSRQTSTLPTTPITMDSPVHNLTDELHHILTALKQLPNLAPGLQVNTLLSRLVNLCAEPYSEDFANKVFEISGMQTLASALRPICAEAEGELERHWARRMLDTSDSVAGKSLKQYHVTLSISTSS